MGDIQKQVQATIDEMVASGGGAGPAGGGVPGRRVDRRCRGRPRRPRDWRPGYPGNAVLRLLDRQGVTATAVHVLAEQGVLDYDTPITEVWPEFATHGKSAITLGHALSQAAGVPGLPPDITIDDLPDWEKMCAVVANEKPWWEPGTEIGYHTITAASLSASSSAG